jgi:tRNA dimethylallyltransferase
MHDRLKRTPKETAPADRPRPSPTKKPRVVVIGGPTAAGKSTAALTLARRANAEIVSADSVQVYRYLVIGSAKPCAAHRRAVVHHLIDVVDPDEPMTAAIYSQRARAAIAQIHQRKKNVVVVGGTGLYIRALLYGLMDAPPAHPALRQKLRRRAETEGLAVLHRALQKVDPETAARVPIADRVRIIRALEVHSLTGIPISVLQKRHAFGHCPYSVTFIVLDPGREALADRIQHRAAKMFDRGLIHETAALLRRGYSPNLRPLRTPGYRQAFAVLCGQMTREEALESVCVDHRRYARRQRVWFKSVTDAQWITAPTGLNLDGLVNWLKG